MYLINETVAEAESLKNLIGVLTRIMSDGELSGRDIRVMLAVLALGGLRNSQIPVPIRISSVSELTNISSKNLWVTLNRLKNRGWLLHASGRGRGNLSRICLRIS